MALQKVTRVALVIDMSTSMRKVREQMVEQYNQIVGTIRDATRKGKQETTVSLIVFNRQVKTRYFDAPIESLKKLTLSEYEPDGGTALFDATATAIEKLESIDNEGVDPSYLVYVMTDGAEMDSQSYTDQKLYQLMKKVQSTDRWTLVFLLPPGEKQTFCNSFEIPAGNVTEWEQSVAGLESSVDVTTTAIGNYYAQRASGKRAVKDFFTDMSGVTAEQVKKSLRDVSKLVHLWFVNTETTIEEFVQETKGCHYTKGAAFYELVKPEKNIGTQKKVMIQDKVSGAIYGGDEARRLLNLPDEKVDIKPLDHGKFRIFIQSLSTNRKLPRGSALIYAPTVFHTL